MLRFLLQLLFIFSVFANGQTTTTAIVTTTITQTITSTPTPTSWSTPQNLTSLSSFNITSFPGPKQNLEIISSLIRIFYPENSLSPGGTPHGTPKGGSQFYASPLPLNSSVTTVSLSYSIWFPQDFAFVKGGKLPGLYGGGHTGCSGGSPAYTCFSTRFMWRTEGKGEVYLYAPRGSQSSALCHAPENVCNDDYGISIGRGTWVFQTGNWTRVGQVVRLNTPGINDGGLRIIVNGVVVYERDDVYYRSQPGGGPLLFGDEVVLVTPDDDDQPIGFTGLFFSTFFGGHDQDWATPKDQYVWFKDFEMEVIA